MNDSPATVSHSRAIDELNHLLRGELSAVQTYEQAVPKFDPYPAAAQELRRIRDEHRETVQLLAEHVGRLGGTPSESSGTWGDFVQAVTGTAKLLGPDTTLVALKRGEEHGVNDYRDALDRDALPAECKDLIRTRLLPRCQEHLANLDSIRSFLS